MAQTDLTVTDSAIARIDKERTKKGNAGLYLMVAVDSGGCSGFRYDIQWRDNPPDGSARVFADGRVVTDDLSLNFLKGATVTFEGGLLGAKFEIRNPNVSSSCGCGESFNL